jgi:hypothetical protein
VGGSTIQEDEPRAAAGGMSALPSCALPCPSCEYDLRGLAANEGRVRCPECGGAHTVDDLLRPPTWVGNREVSPLWVLVVFVPAVVLQVPTLAMHADASALLVIDWCVLVLWAMVAKSRSREISVIMASLAAAATVSAAGLLVRDNRCEIMLSTMMSMNGAGLLLWAAVWLVPPRPSLRGAALLVALVPAAPGVALIIGGAWAFTTGSTWTAFSDPRAGYWYDQWPLDRVDAVVFGLVLMVAGVCIGAIGWIPQGGIAEDSA